MSFNRISFKDNYVIYNENNNEYVELVLNDKIFIENMMNKQLFIDIFRNNDNYFKLNSKEVKINNKEIKIKVNNSHIFHLVLIMYEDKYFGLVTHCVNGRNINNIKINDFNDYIINYFKK